MDSNHIPQTFKDKIISKDSMKFYLIEKNREKFNKVNNKSFHEMHYLLKPIYFKQLNLEVGHSKTVDIEAGKSHHISVEVSVPNSVLCINFQTVEYDIKFGIYTAQIWSKFEVHNAD